jgi:hypothetical protein
MHNGIEVMSTWTGYGRAGGVACDWLCMWREGALEPHDVINIVVSLCADVRFFGLALRMGAWLLGFC